MNSLNGVLVHCNFMAYVVCVGETFRDSVASHFVASVKNAVVRLPCGLSSRCAKGLGLPGRFDLPVISPPRNVSVRRKAAALGILSAGDRRLVRTPDAPTSDDITRNCESEGASTAVIDIVASQMFVMYCKGCSVCPLK